MHNNHLTEHICISQVPAAYGLTSVRLCSYDINLSPDKRKALIQKEQALLELFQEVC